LKSTTHSFVAEIIGPAGSGKTTLSQLLRQKNDVRTGLSVWGLPPSRLALGAVSSISNLRSLVHSSQSFDWDNAKLIVQHNTLLRVIQRESVKGYDALLLDEGTVFALAKLRVYSPGMNGNSELWMQDLFDRLAGVLDAVIWLDAPDAVLTQRIRDRAKPHQVKYESDAMIQDHLMRYRNSYELVVSELSRRNGLQVFKFSTDQLPLEQIADRVLSQVRARG
jgi:deoxyadenosine/deoxycytidine kinase